MESKTKTLVAIPLNDECLHNTCKKPSTDQYVSVNFDIVCIQSGRNDTGNQDPPRADITNITNVLIPLAWFNEIAIEVISIPKDTAAADEAIIIIIRLKKLEKTSTLNRTDEKMNNTSS